MFLLAHDGEKDRDWDYAYTQIAREKGLLGKFFFTTKADIVKVSIYTDTQCFYIMMSVVHFCSLFDGKYTCICN